jgi:hypothetical protein
MSDYEPIHNDDVRPLTSKGVTVWLDPWTDPDTKERRGSVPYVVIDSNAVQQRELAWLKERIARSGGK